MKPAVTLALVVACHASAPKAPAQVTLRWTYTDAAVSDGPPWVDITLAVDGKPYVLDHLDGTADGPSGAQSCVVQNTTDKQVELRCGDVPEYAGYLVVLEKQGLVVYRESGVDQIDRSQVKVIPAQGVASLKVVP
jgi:hypothetical protein